MGIFKRLFRSRDRPENKIVSPPYHFWFGRTRSKNYVNPQTALSHVAVYACIRIISEAVAQLPLHVYMSAENSKEKAVNHPLYFLLHDQPNSEMTSFVFREVMMSHLLIYGNAYAQIIRNGRGEVTKVYPLNPERVTVERDENNKLIYIYAADGAENSVIFRKDQILHIRGLGYDGLIGYSPIAMARNAIGMSMACEDYGSTFFANGASPSGVLEHPGIIKNPEKIREAWDRAYGGSANAHKTIVLEEGMKYSPISIPNNDSQFLETRKFQVEEIARLFRVPLHMLGDLDHATFSNIEELSLEFVKYTLDPWLVRWEQELSSALLLPSERQKMAIKFNVDGLLRGDYASRMQGYATARQNGWMSANDIRELEDMNHISEEEGGDLYLVNGNFVKMKDAGASYAKSKE